MPGWRTSQNKRHVIKHIVAPYGTSIEERPPIPTQEERIAEYEAWRAAKDERRAARNSEVETKEIAERARKKEKALAKLTPAEREKYDARLAAKQEKRRLKELEGKMEATQILQNDMD